LIIFQVIVYQIRIDLEEIWKKTRTDLEKNWKNLFIAP